MKSYSWLNLKRTASILILGFLSWPGLGQAQKKIAYIVGGAEPIKEAQSTVFDYDFYETVRVLIIQGYEIHAYFNGENKVTLENWIKPLRRDPRVKWKPADKKAAIEGLKKLKLKSGDQLVVYILGHGSNPSHPLQHGVIMNDGDLLKLSDIKPILDSKAFSKVNQILIDSTCFSGHALLLAQQNRCVLTSSHENTQGYFAFPRELKRNIELTKRYGGPNSLLDIFLRSRPFMVASHPLISSFKPKSEGLQALHFLTRYQLTIEEYMYFSDKSVFCDYCFIKTHDKFRSELPKVIKSLSTISIPLPEYEIAGIQTTAEEFARVHARLLEIAKMDEEKRKSIENEATYLVNLSKILHGKLVKFERALYNIEISKTHIPNTDPCKRMTL